MKYIYYCLSLLLLSAAIGCTKEADTPNNEPFVTFNPTLDGMSVVSQSRAVSADIDLSALGFSVVGYHTGETFPVSTATEASIVPNIFDKIADATKTVVRKVNAANDFKLPLAKIPLDDESGSIRTYFSFFAWSVTENKNSAGTTVDLITQSTSSAADKGYPYLNITLPAPNAQVQGDVVAAHSLNAPNDYVVSAVDLDFHHLFSKISFKAKATSGAVIQLKKTTIKYAANALHTQARYQFNASDSVGRWTGYSAYQTAGDITPSGFNTPSLTATESFLGSMFVIPQKLKAAGVSVVITYTVTINGKESEPIVRAVPLKAIDLCQGKHYTYTLNIETDQLELINLSVSAWKDVGAVHPMPIIPGAMSDVLLLLDGHDKPYKHPNGKWYWLDRSGYNRHAELVGYYDDMYYAGGYSYLFPNSANVYAKVPAFPAVTALSVDVIAQQNPPNINAWQNILNFCQAASVEKKICVHLGYNNTGNVYFDCSNNISGANGRLIYTAPNQAYFDKKAMWSFTKQDGGKQRIYENAELKAEALVGTAGPLGVLENNRIGNSYGGYVSQVKVTRGEESNAGILNTYKDAIKRFNLSDNGTTLKPPVSDALKICLDGYVKPKTINGTLVWEDIGPAKNHAKLMNDKVKWTDDGSYVLTTGGYMELIKTLVETGVTVDQNSYITIEMVFVPDNESNSHTKEGLLRIYDDPNYMRGSQIWKGEFSGAYYYQILTAYGGGSFWRVSSPIWGDVKARTMHSLVWRDGHKADANSVFIDGIKYTYHGGVAAGHKYCVIGYAADPSEHVNVVKCYYSGKIKAVRIHSRLLTDEEIMKNYQFDKEYYGF